MKHADKCLLYISSAFRPPCIFSVAPNQISSATQTWTSDNVKLRVQAKQQHLQGSGAGSVLPLRVMLRRWSLPKCMPLRTRGQYHTRTQTHTRNKRIPELTLMPVLVASLTAARSWSYLGLKAMVNAQSIIRPGNRKSHMILWYAADRAIADQPVFSSILEIIKRKKERKQETNIKWCLKNGHFIIH